MLIPLILSGGSGTRLWPVSREAYPKPFIKLPDGRSLLQKTLDRLVPLDDVPEVITVTNREHFFATRDEYAAERRSPAATSSCSSRAHATPRRRWPCGVLAIAARHGADATAAGVAGRPPGARRAKPSRLCARDAEQLAEQGHLVTFGIPPTYPETGFGYIERGEALGRGAAIGSRGSPRSRHWRSRQAMIESGRFYWNSGMFCFRAGAFLEELARTAPEIHAGASAVLGRGRRSRTTMCI